MKTQQEQIFSLELQKLRSFSCKTWHDKYDFARIIKISPLMPYTVIEIIETARNHNLNRHHH